MPRSIEISVPSAQAPDLIEQIKGLDGLIGLRHFPGASVKSPGDHISLDITDRSVHGLMRLLRDAGVGREPDTSLVSSMPASVISSQFVEAVARDQTEWTWEEIEGEMARESNMTLNGITVMAVSGFVAALGIATGALHVVIGAMVIAPGFEPLTRIAVGVAAKSRAWRRGLTDVAVAYLTLVVSAMAASGMLRLSGKPILSGRSYLMAQDLVTYWTSVTLASVAVSAVASVGGAVLVAAGRAVLTGGVMIALALIPTMTIVGMALVVGEWELAGKATVRWLIDAGLVVVLSMAVMAWKRMKVHRRPSML